MGTRRALITGISGQDGSLLAEFLVERDYDVFGVVRRPVSERYPNLDAVRDKITLIQADLLDQLSLVDAIKESEPNEIYNLAAPSFIPNSWRQPMLTAQFAAVGTAAMLEATRLIAPEARFYQAASSEIFGEPDEAPQTEATPLAPLTPYGVAKAYSHFLVASYRRRYELHASSGILYNHESPRRPAHFVPSKIAHAAASISVGLADEVRLGSLDARRDWGFAGDYVRAMWLMLQQDEPDDYVIATGVSHSVEDLAEIAFARVGLGWRDYVSADPSLVRGATELHNLVGDASKARCQLGWKPSVDFETLIHTLVDAELDRLGSHLDQMRVRGTF
jgi:GDPmannose 4,6-dehydratase